MRTYDKPYSTVGLVAGAGLLTIQMGLLRSGLRRPIDGWRRASTIVLRGEESTFVLSAFGLAACSDVKNRESQASLSQVQAHIRERLALALRREQSCHVGLTRTQYEDRLHSISRPNYGLAFDAWRAGPDRFVPPAEWPTAREQVERGEDAGNLLLSFVCRANETGECDLWVRCNHAGIDGAPAQEILTRLETAWGSAGPVAYPTPEEFEPYVKVRPCGGRQNVAETQMFVDLQRLQEWRKEQNSRLGEPMTLAAAVMWRLGRHERFARLHIGSTVELPAQDGLGRGVGVVVAAPGTMHEQSGFGSFVRSINQQMARTRLRASPACRTLDAAARLPARFAGELLRHALNTTPKAFGTMAVTMLKDAKVFGAPIADVGHEDGFLAIGGVGLPTANGRKVACICIKGPRKTIETYPTILRSALG